MTAEITQVTQYYYLNQVMFVFNLRTFFYSFYFLAPLCLFGKTNKKKTSKALVREEWGWRGMSETFQKHHGERKGGGRGGSPGAGAEMSLH